MQRGVPQGCSAALSVGLTPQEQQAAASSCGHIVPAPLVGETEESFSCHLLRGPWKWPVPTRHLSPSPTPSPPLLSPPLSLIKLQVNLPGSGPAPGAKRLPADPDLPPCTSVSVPGTARSPHSSSAHGAPSQPPQWSVGCKEQDSVLHLLGCCPGPRDLLALINWGKVQGMGAPTEMQPSTQNTHAHFRARWAKPLTCLELLKTLPAAQLQLRQARHCGMWAPELDWGSAEPATGVLSLAATLDSHNSTCLPRHMINLQFAAGWAPAPGVSSLAGISPSLL